MAEEHCGPRRCSLLKLRLGSIRERRDVTRRLKSGAGLHEPSSGLLESGTSTHICMYVYTYIYIYIYRERERERYDAPRSSAAPVPPGGRRRRARRRTLSVCVVSSCCNCVCMHICISMCTYNMYMYIYIYVYVYTCVCVYTYIHICIHTVYIISKPIYTRSPSQDFRLFGPRPWVTLATTYGRIGS